MPRPARNKCKLTHLTVTKLRPTSHAFLVWDTVQRGLALQIQPSGYRAYKLIYRHHNRPRWFHLGAADAIALDEARRKAAELMAKVLNGADPQAEKRAARGTGTFADIANRYVEEYAKKRNKSWQKVDALIRRYVFPAWGSLSINTITRSDVRALLGRINGPILANQVLACTSAIFTWATRQELLENNPCRGVERNPEVSRERVLSDAELPPFWRAFCDAGLPGAALQILLLTGQRPGEVAHMRHDHIANGWWTMPGAPDANGWPGTKNGATHRVWLPQPVQAIIAALNIGDEYVFGQSVDEGVREAMRRICKQLSVPRATPHDLRRTHGSTITRLGFGRPAMNRIQNHKGNDIADVYDRHRYEDENKRVMESVAKHLLMLASGENVPSNVVRANF
jgi:integrase